MSVIVKNMEMPQTCRECVIGNPKAKTCIIGKPKMNTKRRDDCPLVEIPPHGDLVDRDKLMVDVMDSDLDHLQRDDWKEVVQIVADAPTITPEPHWIPVEQELPKENRVVVVCGDKGTWDFGTYRGHGNDIHFWHWKKNTFKRVYWWMYKEDALPEPFKGVNT